jgi:beta-lactamase superfamily II metal-dependent hydrolase
VVARLADRGIRTWRTDQHGQVRFLTDGHRWRIETPGAPGSSR